MQTARNGWQPVIRFRLLADISDVGDPVVWDFMHGFAKYAIFGLRHGNLVFGPSHGQRTIPR